MKEILLAEKKGIPCVITPYVCIILLIFFIIP